MTAHDVAVFGRAEHTAQEWLDTVAEALGTDDHHYAYRILRTWLHTVRDRLSVDVAVHFAAQLPLLLRGVFFDGWTPSQVPVKYDTEQFLLTFGQEARISMVEARRAAGAVTAALDQHCSPGQVETMVGQLPHALRELLRPGTTSPSGAQAPAEQEAAVPAPRGATVQERIGRIERDVQVIGDAVGALVHGLEELPTEEPSADRTARAARRAHQILLTLSTTADARPGVG
ncbi:DUF2267 domain-containing protein [Pseudonocardia sp. H11422]|uniref:DUF2267 domain-containing protein n=1 Tax=Pseudonocardia sp. H11422 TaxID=2835866 RepID=UPI001BDD75E0|nr:DUF2267 domain-containing protein [Pseudonocardia sp. H11422]